MNKLTFERVELRHERLRKRDAVLVRGGLEFPSAKRKKNVRSLIGEHRWALAHRKLASILLFFFSTHFDLFFFLFFFSFVLFHVTRGCRVSVNRAPRKSVVTADRVYAHIARGSLWPSVTVYSFRSYFVPVALKKSQSIRDKYAYIPMMATCPDMSWQLPGCW